MTAPESGVCPRCGQTRPLFPPDQSWDWQAGPLCTTDWQIIARARETGQYVDFNDAFDNAPDGVLSVLLSPYIAERP